MTVLVTGASGFIGAHVVAALLAAGHAVRALVRATSATAALARPGIERVLGDLTDGDSLVRACRGADAVVHAAGLVKALDRRTLMRVNGEGPGRLAAAAAGAGVGRLVLVSSLAARGPEAGLGPVSAYGRSKLEGERQALAAAAPAECVVVRPTAVYGPGDRALLPVFRLARRGLRPVLAGGGRLTLVHAADLGRGLAALVQARLAPGRVLEVSDGRTYTWDEVVRSVAEAVGRPGRTLSLPGWILAAAALASDAMAQLSRRPQVLGRDKLAELRASWPADPGPFWEASGIAPGFDLVSGTVDAARAYRELGWL